MIIVKSIFRIIYQAEIGMLSDLEKNVISSLKEDKSIVSIVEDEEETRSFGQKIADNVADFGGSWTFIISFVAFYCYLD